jgi:hypothetical protein
MPSNRPDRAEAIDAYQSDSGVGAQSDDAMAVGQVGKETRHRIPPQNFPEDDLPAGIEP